MGLGLLLPVLLLAAPSAGAGTAALADGELEVSLPEGWASKPPRAGRLLELAPSGGEGGLILQPAEVPRRGTLEAVDELAAALGPKLKTSFEPAGDAVLPGGWTLYAAEAPFKEGRYLVGLAAGRGRWLRVDAFGPGARAARGVLGSLRPVTAAPPPSEEEPSEAEEPFEGEAPPKKEGKLDAASRAVDAVGAVGAGVSFLLVVLGVLALLALSPYLVMKHLRMYVDGFVRIAADRPWVSIGTGIIGSLGLAVAVFLLYVFAPKGNRWVLDLLFIGFHLFAFVIGGIAAAVTVLKMDLDANPYRTAYAGVGVLVVVTLIPFGQLVSGLVTWLGFGAILLFFRGE